MSSKKPTLPSGTRDFGPEQVRRRRWIMDTIRAVFERYGYQPIETPAMENLSVLEGKYGEEGDRLLFRILNQGDNASNPPERGLRYDLTVPFARYVVMHQHELTLPFRRYQMQPVWRGDRPQRGRYREFWQCDADVVGSTSLMHEAEFIQIYVQALTALGLERFSVRVNHRQVLGGLAALIGAADRFADLTIALDKLDKVGRDGVRQEFESRGLGADRAEALFAILDALDDRPLAEQVAELRARFAQGLPAEHPAHAGVKDLEQVFDLAITHGGVPASSVALDLTLARGLSYYTGCIFEVVTHEVQMGSIGGGGRYDNLTAAFGAKEALPGAGISFGLDRIYDVIEALGRFPAAGAGSLQVLVVQFAPELATQAFERVTWLRSQGIAAELYPEATKKIGKQFEYADRRGVPWAWVEGPDDRAAGVVQLKDLRTGQQQALAPEEAMQRLR